MSKIKELSLDKDADTSSFLSVLKGTFWAISMSLICVLIFAFVIKFTSISENLITPINQVIKIVSILFGAYVMSKKLRANGWLWGLILGAMYTLLAFVIFSILNGQFDVNISLLNDLIFGSIIGLIAGIITFAIKK